MNKASIGKRSAVDTEPETFSRSESMLVTFCIIAVAQGVSGFILEYAISLEFPNGFFVPWLDSNVPLLGLSPLGLLADLVFPVSAFIALYMWGDGLMLSRDLQYWGLSMALGGPVGGYTGSTLGLALFRPTYFSLPELDIASVCLTAFYAFVVGFAAVALRHVKDGLFALAEDWKANPEATVEPTDGDLVEDQPAES